MRETEGESTKITADVTPSLDLIFDILSNRRRRYALYYLHERQDGVATMDELIDAVIRMRARDPEVESASPADASADGNDAESDREEQRLRIRTELQHTHLPKLEDAGILEHDQRSETVRYWTQPSLEEWLEHAHHKELVQR